MVRIIVLVVLATVALSAPGSHAGGPLIVAGEEVDLQLVLAADISGSMSTFHRDAQRRGFAAAFRDRSLQRAVLSGPLGRIAVTYFEWAEPEHQRVIVPWTVVSTPTDLIRFAETLETATDDGSGGGTSISGAMKYAHRLIAESSAASYRKVVDISGNGRDSQGSEVAPALRGLREIGVTVNGLVFPESGLGYGPYDGQLEGYDVPLAEYYRSEVIGGPGAFAIEVDPAEGFGNAILRKLVMEIAWAD